MAFRRVEGEEEKAGFRFGGFSLARGNLLETEI
jgi:hypothetical protein